MATLTVGFTVWYGELRRGELGCPLESLTFSRPCTQLHACISHMLVLLVLPDVPGCWRCLFWVFPLCPSFCYSLTVRIR